MHRTGHRGERDDASAALQRMKSAKCAVEPRAVLRTAFERQQVGGGALDVFARLEKELLDEFIHRAFP